MPSKVPEITLPYPVHPACEIFPQMTGEDFNELVEDIRAHGLREPITLHENRIVDGRNRARACVAADVEPRFEPWDGRGSVLDFVISKNLVRRHLTYDQRVGLAARLREMLAKEAGKRVGGRPAIGKLPPKSEEVFGESAQQAAKLLDVGRTAVAEVAAEQKHDPTIPDKLIAGKLTVSAIRNQGRQRKADAALLAWIAALDKHTHDDTMTITENSAVVQCQAVITAPPLGAGPERWDAARLEAFTTAWAGPWNRCGADAVVIFCSQEFLFELRRWLDAALTNYEFQGMLMVVDQRTGEPPAPGCDLLRMWQPILVYTRPDRNVFPPRRHVRGKTERIFPDTHIISTRAEGLPLTQWPASVFEWLIPAVSVSGALIADPFHQNDIGPRVAQQLGRNYHGITLEAGLRAYAPPAMAPAVDQPKPPRPRYPSARSRTENTNRPA